MADEVISQVAEFPPLNLNLAADYCPTWGMKEGVREFYANAIDAEKNPVIETPSDNDIVIRTTTSPSVSELAVMGRSSKRGDTSKIGQFGEGIKVGANALIRAGCRLTIQCPHGTFEFRHIQPPGIDCTLLHLVRSGPPIPFGCTVYIKGEGVARCISEVALPPGTKLGPLPRRELDACNIFCKGIWVQRIPDLSLWDWNLDIALNRDRSAANSWDLHNAIARELGRSTSHLSLALTPENEQTVERKALRSSLYTQCSAKVVHEALLEIDEDYLVKSDNDRANRSAPPTACLLPMDDLLHQMRQLNDYEKSRSSREQVFIRIAEPLTVDDLVGETESVPEQHRVEVERCLQLLGVAAKVVLFEPNQHHGNKDGFSHFASRTIGIRRDLFEPGKRMKRLAVIFHEAGHLQSNCEDLTPGFEEGLTELGGHLLSMTVAREGA